MKFFRLAILLLVLRAGSGEAAGSWPTLHRDNQRSGYTGEMLRGPLVRKWYRSFVEEMIGARAEAIVAEDRCFIGTYAGNLYALDVVDGSTSWKCAAGAPIGHSPCFRDGRLFFGTDAGRDASRLVCLDARTGEELWSYRTGAGIWNSPTCAGTKVYVGDRGGVFHALDAATGQLAWTFRAGYMILKPASITADGQQIVFGAEDMHIYCLSPDGRLLWKSPKLPGLSLRDAAPTIWGEKVVVRTNPPLAFHESLGQSRTLLRETQRSLPLVAEDKVIVETENMYFLRRTRRRERAENEAVCEYLARHPERRTWFTLGLRDGTEPWVAPVLYTGGMHNPASPPTFRPGGKLYTIMPTALGVYCSGVSQLGIGIGCVEAETGYVENIAHAHGDVEPGYFAGMPMIADETSSLALMNEFLAVTHMGAVGGVDLAARRIGHLAGIRDTYGGLFGPGAAAGSWEGSRRLAEQGYVQNTVNEWHGPDRSVAAISDGQMFWVVGSSVVCLGSPPARYQTRSEPPEPFRWQRPRRIDGGNLTGPLGGYDSTAVERALRRDEVEKYLAEPATEIVKVNEGEATKRLDAAVLEVIEGEPWAPLVVELGISGEEIHFARAAETMQSLAMSLPWLSPVVRAGAIACLDRFWNAGVPLDKTEIGGSRRREYYDLAPEVLERVSLPSRPQSLEPGDLYAVWAYAHHADRWERVLARIAEIRARYRPRLFADDQPPSGDRPDFSIAALNRRIAGGIAYVRIMRHAGEHEEADRGAVRLAELVSQRVHFERAESRLQSPRAHHANIPRYLYLTPELGRILADHAGDETIRNLADLDCELPVWYQAWGERLIGGENYTNPPSLSHGLFLAHAYGLSLPRGELERLLDQPWCRADLYYLDKLAAIARLNSREGCTANE